MILKTKTTKECPTGLSFQYVFWFFHFSSRIFMQQLFNFCLLKKASLHVFAFKRQLTTSMINFAWLL